MDQQGVCIPLRSKAGVLFIIALIELKGFSRILCLRGRAWDSRTLQISWRGGGVSDAHLRSVGTGQGGWVMGTGQGGQLVGMGLGSWLVDMGWRP